MKPLEIWTKYWAFSWRRVNCAEQDSCFGQNFYFKCLKAPWCPSDYIDLFCWNKPKPKMAQFPNVSSQNQKGFFKSNRASQHWTVNHDAYLHQKKLCCYDLNTRLKAQTVGVGAPPAFIPNWNSRSTCCKKRSATTICVCASTKAWKARGPANLRMETHIHHSLWQSHTGFVTEPALFAQVDLWRRTVYKHKNNGKKWLEIQQTRSLQQL